MKEEKLKELLEKYYNGDSSLEEERLLKKYFEGDIILPGYEVEKDIFIHFSRPGDIPEPSENLEMRIRESIDNLDTKQKKTISFRWYYATAGIAAILMITFGLLFFLKQNAEPKDTFSDPVLAYAETMKVLNNISEKLNKGTKSLKPVGKLESAAKLSIESIDRSVVILSNSIRPIENLNRLSDSTQNLNK
jgi:hypothetical protein